MRFCEQRSAAFDVLGCNNEPTGSDRSGVKLRRPHRTMHIEVFVGVLIRRFAVAPEPFAQPVGPSDAEEFHTPRRRNPTSGNTVPVTVLLALDGFASVILAKC